ncbi:DUF1292 domain-containing protein [Alkalihalobacterium chitinilyticum]|uniref:DUF1292 domain-containing protein n=1 Tax=Alkalihalobacterium chitinilyticum TaxID=2980103 RepID=A0ABT5VI78_9BACI|nr:DUF1292 domain-containing protein [Alkalihalobacterium chitinilyticum]MDE5414447.1 DUF1292 domain-containing protein [Alkalihalobacterium chitinilyticum]
MEPNELRDHITVEDEHGNEMDYAVEALFDMDEHSYALLSSDDEIVLMRVEDHEGEQQLVGLSDPEERDAILSAYEIAVEANPAEDENDFY